MINEDHTLLSLKYKRECIPGYILYWDTSGYIVYVFDRHGVEIKHGTPERALMRYMLHIVRRENEKST